MTPRQPVRLVGRYLLCDVFASGGMATVHFARMVGQEGFSRTVAVKQLYPHFSRDRAFVSMFFDEARFLSRIRHPNVVAPLDIVALDSELFIAMEYVHGEAVSQLLKVTDAPVPPAIASAIMVQALLGLHAAHEATGENGQPLRIVHRDVSPQNVLVGQDGLVKVVDFGISKAAFQTQTTDEGRLKGKLGYMAPEQIRREPVDRRADLYTSGIVLWELLTGQRLFAADNPGAAIESILENRVVAPSSRVPGLPEALDRMVLRALALDPGMRFENARLMALELAQVLPPAGALEVGAWVDRIAGRDLALRADQIAELESQPIETLLKRRAARASSLPSTGEDTDLAIIPSSAGPASTPEPGRPRLLVLAGAAVLATSALAFWFMKGNPQGPAANSAVSSRSPATLPAPVASLPSSANAQPPAAPIADVVERPTPAADPAKAVAPTPSVVRSDAPKVANAPSVAKASPAKTPVPKRASRSQERCKVPYTVDANGRKRFKEECF